jgi:hypothetical protein
MVEFAGKLCLTKIRIFKFLKSNLKNTYISSYCAKFHVFMMFFFSSEKWKLYKMTDFGPKTRVTLRTHRTNFIVFLLFFYFFRWSTSYRLKIHQICQGFLTFNTRWTFGRKFCVDGELNIYMFFTLNGFLDAQSLI